MLFSIWCLWNVFFGAVIFLCRPATWRRLHMETFSALLAICAINLPVTGEFPEQRQVTRSFDIFFDLRLNEGWINNREAGELRCHRAHYDVTVMTSVDKGIKVRAIDRSFVIWGPSCHDRAYIFILYQWTHCCCYGTALQPFHCDR